MEQFYKFEVVSFNLPMGDTDMEFKSYDSVEDEDENVVEYKILPIRLSSIITYHPLDIVDMKANQEEIEHFDEDDLWDLAEYVNVILVDGTQVMVKCQIKEFEKILFGEE